MLLRLSTPPAIEPVSLAEAKAWVSQDTSVDDTIITLLISAARQYVEQATGRALITQTWQAIEPEWPRLWTDAEDTLSPVIPSAVAASSMTVVKLPLISVTGMTVAGNAFTAYTVDRIARGFRIKPTITVPTGEVVVTFTAGYGTNATDVPADLRVAILKLIASAYDNRGATGFDVSGLTTSAEKVPGFKDTIARHRIMT
jgi:uncharacterized phiE125 gp8 family phage protein